MPRPSHPRRIKIKWGMKIKKNIERIKKITRRVKRGRKGSVCIYDWEKRRTLAAIKKIVVEKRRAGGSRSSVKLIWREVSVIRFHSRIMVESLRTVNRERARGMGVARRRARGAECARENMV